MGQYKVPQNVEAEDKILGPLTIKQFIYIIIALMWGFIAIRLLAPFNLIIGIVLALPVSGTLLALGLIQREGVSFENYFLAFIRYNLYPHKRIWMKDSNPEIIKNAPAKNVAPEVRKTVNQGQLKQLAFIVDTRGNYKDPNLQLPDATNMAAQMSARVVGPGAQAQAVQAMPGQAPARTGPLVDAGVLSPDATNAAIQKPVAQGVAAAQPQAQTMATPEDDILDESSTQSADVGALLQNVEVNLRNRTIAKMKQTLTAAPKAAKTTTPAPTLTSNRANAQMAAATSRKGSGGTISGNQVADALAHLSQQSNHLSVQQLATQADKSMPLSEGQEVQLRS